MYRIKHKFSKILETCLKNNFLINVSQKNKILEILENSRILEFSEKFSKFSKNKILI